MVHTKIVATLGPASADEPILRQLLTAGLDVARLNFSHGDHQEKYAILQRLRSAAAGRPVAILGDLCGPKIRISGLSGPTVAVKPGDEVTIYRTPDRLAGPRAMAMSHPDLVDEVDIGHRVLIEDGLIQLRVSAKKGDRLVCQCLVGGVIAPRKGVNLPDSTLTLPAIMAKDLTDLDWALAHDLDYIALSFVRTAADLDALRGEIDRRGGGLRIVAKIETPAAVRNIDAIIQRSDAILIARGDLGVEMDLVEIPVLQKDIARRCRAAGVPVIVATQMLHSMIESPTPTRAEVSDVANAILDGADAVMLSGETAVGKYPAEAIGFMNRILARTEVLRENFGAAPGRVEQASLKVTSAVARSAAMMAREHAVKAVVVWTRTGNTARLLSKHHLPQPILAFAPDDRVCRRLALLSGVTPARVDRPADERVMIQTVDRELVGRGWAQRSDLILIVAGTDRTTPGASDAVIVHFVDDA